MKFASIIFPLIVVFVAMASAEPRPKTRPGPNAERQTKAAETEYVKDFKNPILFSHDERLGFLTYEPTNLGTFIRASIHIKVPKLNANLDKLEKIGGEYNLKVRGTHGRRRYLHSEKLKF